MYTMDDTGFNSQKRRGIATIIGSFFFLILMVGTFTALFGVFAYQADLINTQNVLATLDIKKANENFAIITSCTFTNPDWDLGVSVQNLGANHVEVVDLWIIEQGVPTSAPTQIIIDGKDAFIPPGGTGNILLNQASAPVIATQTYTIKVVTTLGTIITKNVVPPCVGEDALDTIQDELVAKPAVYAAFPNPWIKNQVEGFFSIIIVNPTNTDMVVYRASMQLLSVANQNNFDTTGVACSAVTNISPSANWCNILDTVYWESTTGTTVTKYTAVDFSVRATPAAVDTAPITTINTNAWTSFGQFGSLKLDTLGSNTAGTYAIPNVFMGTQIQDPATATLDPPIYNVMTGSSGQSHDFWITIYNSADDGEIAESSTLIINLPPLWVYNTSIPGDSHLTSVTTVSFDDESTQLRVSLDETAGDDTILAQKWKTFHFQATAPVVADPTLYIFYTFATGTVTKDNAADPILMGPLAENVIRVCPTSGCPA